MEIIIFITPTPYIRPPLGPASQHLWAPGMLVLHSTKATWGRWGGTPFPVLPQRPSWADCSAPWLDLEDLAQKKRSTRRLRSGAVTRDQLEAESRQHGGVLLVLPENRTRSARHTAVSYSLCFLRQDFPSVCLCVCLSLPHCASLSPSSWLCFRHSHHPPLPEHQLWARSGPRQVEGQLWKGGQKETTFFYWNSVFEGLEFSQSS